MGYIDYCPNPVAATDERMRMTDGISLFPTPNYFFSRKTVETDFGLFVIFLVWEPKLWFVVLLWVICGGFFIRFTSGYYVAVKLNNITPYFLILEVIDLLWFGGGLLLDVIYPQTMPTTASKIILLSFEFIQLLLLSSITASLTKFLVMKEEIGINHLHEIVTIPNTKLCFKDNDALDQFLINYPDFLPEKVIFCF